MHWHLSACAKQRCRLNLLLVSFAARWQWSRAFSGVNILMKWASINLTSNDLWQRNVSLLQKQHSQFARVFICRSCSFDFFSFVPEIIISFVYFLIVESIEGKCLHWKYEVKMHWFFFIAVLLVCHTFHFYCTTISCQ